MQNEIRCAQCGARVEADDSYCPKCHASISERDKQDETMFEGIEIEVWKQYIGDRAVDYLEIFKKHDNKSFFLSFNPYAFFLNTTWMYYRNMFLEGVITTLVQIAIIVGVALLITVSSPLMLVMFPAALVFHFCVGAFSNCLYKNHIKRLILKNNRKKLGGTSYAAAFIGAVLSNLFITVVTEPLLAEILLNI